MFKKTKSEYYFKKSIESTIRAISEKKSLNIFFGDNIKNKSHDIVLPSIKNTSNSNIKIIRGIGDSLSLKEKFHSSKLHQKISPQNEIQRKIFDELEGLRCEVLGSIKMPGIKKNISEFTKIEISKETKISQEKTIKLILRDKLLNDKLSAEYKKKLDKIYKKVVSHLKKKKIDFSKLVINQELFGTFVKDLLKDIFLEDTKDDKENTSDNNSEDNKEEYPEQKSEDDPKIDKPMHTDELLEKNEKDKINESRISELSEVNSDDSNIEFSNDQDLTFSEKVKSLYKVYTSKFDSMVNAVSLSDSQEIIKLRKQLDKQTDKLDKTITILANKLQRKLLAKQKRWWEFDLEEGVLDSGKLARVIISPDNSLSYKKEAEADFKDTIVSLLIDNSGSMRGRPITIAAISTDILVKTLERCGVKVEVLGFTTKTWKGGRARDLWIKNNKPDRPGRLNELLHIIYKHADQPIRRSKQNFGIMLKEGLLKENIDGEALEWAFKRILYRPEKRKILMVISDGAPVDDSTLSSNDGSLLDMHLKEVIRTIEKKSSVELTAVGIGHDVSRYYSKAVTIIDVDELAEVMSKKLIEIF
ncbi:MAG: cobalamin biosynthesis protein CobT [Pseudomonadota bacterium]|nr:cobalamin biosynthesis protein CobT [Pseudomonadota bacterium]